MIAAQDYCQAAIDREKSIAWKSAYDSASATAMSMAESDLTTARNSYSMNSMWAGRFAHEAADYARNMVYQSHPDNSAVMQAAAGVDAAKMRFDSDLNSYNYYWQTAYDNAYSGTYDYAAWSAGALLSGSMWPADYGVYGYIESSVNMQGFGSIADSYASDYANKAVQGALAGYASSMINQESSRFVSEQVDSALASYETGQMDIIIPGIIETAVQQQNSMLDSISRDSVAMNSNLAMETAKAIAGFGSDTFIAGNGEFISSKSSDSMQASLAGPSSLSDLSANSMYGLGEGDKITAAVLMDAFASVAPEISTMAAESIFTGANTEGNPDAFVMLADIINSPTAEQKEALGAAIALLDDMDRMQKEGADPAKVAEMKNDVAKMVAATILAQALPDLLKDGDVAAMRESFAELGARKGELLAKYQESVKPYYDEVRKDLAGNIESLQLSNVLSDQMTRKDIDLLPPNEIEKIIEKLRKAKTQSSEAEHVLNQEAKYRKKYIDPSRESLEHGMKKMLEDFSSRITAVITDAGVAKKNRT
jgi:hypothetical protein